MSGSVIGIVLAAGRSTRMGDQNKLSTPWQGKPLVRHVVDAALASDLTRVVVVTGHEDDQIEAVLDPKTEVEKNSAYREGMASSLCAGVARAKKMGAGAVMVLLGDMPLVTSEHINQIVLAAGEAPDSIVQARAEGQPGNPVLFPAPYFDQLLGLEGDRGARTIIARHPDRVIPVEIGEAALRDFDTTDAFHLP